MDCEKLESAMMEDVYGELDELTSAAAKKHVAGCARCAARLGALRATRLAAALPLEPAPPDLEGRILGAAERAWGAGTGPSAAHSPGFGRKVARAASIVLSLAGSWAMRPQTAMAAVFLVMVGTSLLLLRGQSARAPDTAEVTVTEHGTPAPALSGDAPARIPGNQALEPSRLAFEDDSKASANAGGPARTSYPAPPPAPDATNRGSGGATVVKPRAAASKAALRAADEEAGNPRFEAALANYRASRFAEAARAFDALAAADPNATLWAARSVREGQGCAAAVSRFDRAARQGRQSSSGWQALFDGAVCYKEVGDYSAARARLGPLLAVDSFKGRARSELSRVELLQSQQGDVSMVNAESRARATSVPAAAAPPPAAPASQVDEPAGSVSPR